MGFRRTWTTGTIDLVPGTFTVKFDIYCYDCALSHMVGPDNVGLAVSPTNDAYGGGGGMGQFGGDDVIFYANGAYNRQISQSWWFLCTANL